MIKAIFFDIDDTLYDSTRLATMARKNSIQAMIDAGLPIKDEGKVYEILKRVIAKFGSNYQRHYDRLMEELNLEANPKIVAAGVVAYERTKMGYLKPFPGVIPTLIRLKNGYKLGVISNGLAIKQWEKLIGLGIYHFFAFVATSEELGYEKPEREIFDLAMKKLEVKPRECVMVGDKLDTDILGASKVGMYAVLKKSKTIVKKTSAKKISPDFEIMNISEIFQVLDRIR